MIENNTAAFLYLCTVKKEYITPASEEIRFFSGDIICQSGGLDDFNIGDSQDGDELFN